MSDSSPTTTNSTEPPFGEAFATGLPKPALDWRDNLAKQWWGRKIADEALQVEKDRRRQLMVERLVRKTQDGTLGQPTEDPEPSDDMAVRVGDEWNYHYHGRMSGGSGAAGKVALGAALLAGGVGLGALAPIALAWLNRPAGEYVDTDTNSAYTVEIGKEPVD